MKRKVMNLFVLFGMLSSFLSTPLTVVAETISQPQDGNVQIDNLNTNQSVDRTTSNKEEEIKATSDTNIDSPEAVSSTESGQEKTMESTQISDQQERAPNVKPLSLTDLSADVDIIDVVLSKYVSGNYIPITDGDSIQVGDRVKLDIKWEMDDTSGIEVGDYIEIDLPAKFIFPNSTKPFSISFNGSTYNVGDFQVVDGKIRLTFNSAIKDNYIHYINNAYFELVGSAKALKDESESIIIGDKELPPFTIGESDVYHLPRPDGFSKDGWQRTNKNEIAWNVDVGLDNLYDAYLDVPPSNHLINAVVVDELPPGLKMANSEKIYYQIPVYMVTAAGRITGENFYTIETSRNKIASSGDYDTDLTNVKANIPGSYTVLTKADGTQVLIANLGDLPGNIDDGQHLAAGGRASALAAAEAAYTAQGLPEANKEATLKALENLFKNTGNTGVAGVRINFYTSVDESKLGESGFSNIAHLLTDNGVDSNAEKTVSFSDIKGGGSGGENKGSVKIIKVDESNTSKLLSGAVFELYSVDGTGAESLVESGTTNASGEISFTNLTVGKYKIKEKTPPNGYENSNYEQEFTVSASDLSFTYTVKNKQKAAEVSIEATKILEGRTLKNNEFSFELRDESDTVLQTKKNDDSGSIKFDAISYTAAGTYNYTINEVSGSEIGITFDTHKLKVKVVVEDNAGKLEATASYEGEQTFTNSYKPSDGSVVLTANKVLTGKELLAGSYSFELRDDTDKVIQTKKNDTVGAINFDEITYTKAGTYNYTINEVSGSETGITYDMHKLKVKVVVEDKDGKLEAAVTYDGSQTFTNNYKPSDGSIVLSANKVLTGKELLAGMYSFELRDDTDTVIQTKKNDAVGAINFDAIAYTKAGTYNYTINEESGTETGVTYDTHKLKVKVLVEDKAGKLEATASYEGEQTFTNVYKGIVTDGGSKGNTHDGGKYVHVSRVVQKILPATGSVSGIGLSLLGIVSVGGSLKVYSSRKKEK